MNVLCYSYTYTVLRTINTFFPVNNGIVMMHWRKINELWHGKYDGSPFQMKVYLKCDILVRRISFSIFPKQLLESNLCNGYIGSMLVCNGAKGLFTMLELRRYSDSPLTFPISFCCGLAVNMLVIYGLWNVAE